jgi:hypothetical protein
MAIFKKLFKRLKRICPPNNGTGSTNYQSIKLVRSASEAIGVGFHRSGWPYVFKFLETISSRDGILFDDFVEQNFCYKDNPTVYREPWVGVFHHPPTIPYFGNQRESLELMFKKPEFMESAKNLKLAIALSEHLGTFLRKHLKCPVLVLTHPAALVKHNSMWTPHNYRKNRDQQLVQVGYYLRNTQLINQIPHSHFRKTRLWTSKEWVQIFDERVRKYYAGVRTEYGGYHDKIFIPASQYDRLLERNVVVMEVFDASASNGVLDCMVRNTPIVINRNPAVVEYLGKDYPLYFTNPVEIPRLVDSKVQEAHRYLVAKDKANLNPELFIIRIMEAIGKL